MTRLPRKFSVLINTYLSVGLIRSKNFRNIYKNYMGNRGDPESADTSFDELSRRNFAPGPVKHVYVEDKKIKHHHPHHKRHHHYRHKHSKNYIYYYHYHHHHHHHHHCVNDKKLEFDWFLTARKTFHTLISIPSIFFSFAHPWYLLYLVCYFNLPLKFLAVIFMFLLDLTGIL